MSPLLIKISKDFATIWTTIDPIGNVAIFAGLTAALTRAERHRTALRAVLYAMMELVKNVDGNEVLAHLTLNVPDYYANQTQRDRVVALADSLAKKLETSRPDEASAARILRELVKNQRLE